MSILTLATFEDYIRNELGAVDTAHTATALAAAEAALNSVCQRQWTVAPAAPGTAMTFIPSRMSVQRIPDAVAITTVVLAGVTIDAAGYQGEPTAPALDGIVEPYRQLWKLSGTWTGAQPGKADLVITARWGWAAIPAVIVEACKIVGKGIVEYRNARGGVIASDMFGPVRISRKALDQLSILDFDRFVRVERIGVA